MQQQFQQLDARERARAVRGGATTGSRRAASRRCSRSASSAASRRRRRRPTATTGGAAAAAGRRCRRRSRWPPAACAAGRRVAAGFVRAHRLGVAASCSVRCTARCSTARSRARRWWSSRSSSAGWAQPAQGAAVRAAVARARQGRARGCRPRHAPFFGVDGVNPTVRDAGARVDPRFVAATGDPAPGAGLLLAYTLSTDARPRGRRRRSIGEEVHRMLLLRVGDAMSGSLLPGYGTYQTLVGLFGAGEYSPETILLRPSVRKTEPHGCCRRSSVSPHGSLRWRPIASSEFSLPASGGRLGAACWRSC